MKKKALALAVAASMAMALTACGSKPAETTAAETTTAAEKADDAASDAAEETTEAAAEAEGGVLVMATNAEFPPYEYHEGDKIVGIDVEIAEAIAAELGMTLEIEDMAFDSIIPAVTSGKADFGAAGMTVTEERKSSVDFTDTYATAAQVIIVKEGSDIATAEDLNGKVVGVQLGTTGDLLVSDEVEGATVEQYNKGFEAVQALMQDKIDAVVIDGAPAKEFVSQGEGLMIAETPLTEESYAIAVKKGNTELVDKMNAALKKLSEDGTLDQIVAKYIPAE